MIDTARQFIALDAVQEVEMLLALCSREVEREEGLSFELSATLQSLLKNIKRLNSAAMSVLSEEDIKTGDLYWTVHGKTMPEGGAA